MARQNYLNDKQVLSRMRRGDLPTMKGGYSLKAVFEDGAVAGNLVMRRLLKKNLIDLPKHTSVSSPFTLTKEATESK